MRARLVKIGNSRGVRLPKPLIEEAGLTDEVELVLGDGTVIIAPAKHPRAGWAEGAKALRARNEDRLVHPPAATRFDDEDWKW